MPDFAEKHPESSYADKHVTDWDAETAQGPEPGAQNCPCCGREIQDPLPAVCSSDCFDKLSSKRKRK